MQLPGRLVHGQLLELQPRSNQWQLQANLRLPHARRHHNCFLANAEHLHQRYGAELQRPADLRLSLLLGNSGPNKRGKVAQS